VEVLAALFFEVANRSGSFPRDPDRDRIILSKGHAAPALYAALAEAGYFPMEELERFRRIDGLLEGHPCIQISGVDLTTGSLGLGLSGGCGMALAARLLKKDRLRVFVILGDGECNEGQVWEAAMAASHFQLDNLVAIVDRNGYQNDGSTSLVMNTEPLAAKWASFGWHTLEIDGNDMDQVCDALHPSQRREGTPTAIIASTVKGCGVSYLLNKPELHYKAPTTEQKDMALAELGF
jgi:transketolase